MPYIDVSLFGELIPKTEEATLLGVTFDRKFTFSLFVEKLIHKFKYKLKLMYRLRGTNWGASPEILVRLYKSFIRPVLEYAAPVLMCISQTRMRQLQVCQNKALKMAL